MVRAGKVAKGFTPRGAEKVQEIDAQTDPTSTVIPRLKEWWSAFVIQRAWRRKRDGRIPLRWDGSCGLACEYSFPTDCVFTYHLVETASVSLQIVQVCTEDTT